MSKSVAIVQSNYIPWKGYFDLIRSVDEFILLDDVQFTRRDWRNRNVIKTPDGPLWLTIPVVSKGRYEQAIRDVIVSNPEWRLKHWNTIATFYPRARRFKELRSAVEELYRGCTDDHLSAINCRLIRGICDILGIRTPITWSMDYSGTPEDATARLVSLCRQAGASTYLSGPAARAYLNVALFAEAGINVRFADYSGYPEYEQIYPPFRHEVSILDLLFHTGGNALEFMKLL